MARLSSPAVVLLLAIAITLLLLPEICHCASIGSYCDKSFKGGGIQASRDRVLRDLGAKAPVDGFAVSSSGKGASAVYGLAQCRGDVSKEDCSACIATAVKDIVKSCPNQADARIWYDFCFMRYSTDNFVGQSDTGYAVIYVNVDNATNPDEFDKEAGALLTRVRNQAVVPGRRNFATGQTQFSPYVTIYGLAGCTRDLAPLPCAQCLSAAVARFPDYCRFRKGCQIHYSSCSARYEIYPFFFPLAATQKAAAAAAASRNLKLVLRA